MGKKKIIAKQQKPAKVEKQQKVVEKVEKKSKKSAGKQQGNVQVFTQQFYSRLNNFQSFYREVLQLKSTANNTDLNQELGTVNTRVRVDLETASSKILRNELVDLQKWIQSEQERLGNQINTVRNCLEQNQKSLESTKAFNVDEITNQLQPIQQKIDEKQAVLDNYQSLLARSRGIYGQGQSNEAEINEDEMNLE